MALRNLKELYPSIIYVCIGYGDEEENLKKLVNELNLNNHVLFLKNIETGLKNALLSKSNIFVMPSVIHNKSVEGFGISYIEAAQYGVPSIGEKMVVHLMLSYTKKQVLFVMEIILKKYIHL